MIPILYVANERDFSHNGIGLLRDTISCEVTEERNGVFEIALSYPVEGQFFDYISEELIVKAKPNETSEPQLFRLYKSSKPIDGIVVWNGEHISYEMNGNPVKSFEVKSGTAGHAIQKALSEATFEHGFSGWSDIATLNSTTIAEPASVRSIFGGISGSILDRWGGEYEFDNFNIKLHSHRGKETDIVIEYGKNLTDIKQEKNIAAVYTAIFPWAKYTTEDELTDGKVTIEHTLTLPEKIIAAPNASSYAHSKALIMDFSEEFKDGEIPTEATLRQKAVSYMNRNPIDVPDVNITASFVQLWQTPEYKNIAPLERVCLCDTVTVRFQKLGISATAKIIKTVYDVLTEQYKSVELGNAKSNFGDTLNKQKNDIANIINTIKTGAVKTSEAIKEAVTNATNLITGNSGGYVVLHPAEMPQEILILDTPELETAVNVWRWNSSGLGYSSTGYNGEYGLALTMDGAINADFITAGIIRGDLLEANSVKASALSVSYRNEVTSEIGTATEIVEQAFVAADEQLKSLITSVTTTLSGDVETMEGKISSLQQTIENLTISFSKQYTGGINNVRNSSGLNGVSSEWGYSGTVTALQNGEAKNNTLSGSYFCIQPGTLSQSLTILSGSLYTLTFKAKKNSSRSWVRIVSGGNISSVFDEQLATEWQEYSITFVASNQTVSLEAGSVAGYIYLADIMLTEGDAKIKWTPAPNEIYTTDVKIDSKGINITNAASQTSTVINNVEFAVMHKNEKVITVNKDLTLLKKSEIADELTIGKLRFSPFSDGCNLVLLD